MRPHPRRRPAPAIAFRSSRFRAPNPMPNPVAHTFRGEAVPLCTAPSIRLTFSVSRLGRYSAGVRLYIVWKNDNPMSSRAHRDLLSQMQNEKAAHTATSTT
jgi:hypothetical protein